MTLVIPLLAIYAETLKATQVLDGALRTTVDGVGGELFTIVHQPEGPAARLHCNAKEGGASCRTRTIQGVVASPKARRSRARFFTTSVVDLALLRV